MRDAVTAVLMHRDELFVIRRQPYLRAFPGYLAFPGGKIDDDDHQHRYSEPLLRQFPPGRMRALCRELQEELGFDLQAAVRNGQVERLCELGVAITPPSQQVRFRLHYYKVVLSRRPRFTPDSNEIAWSGWRSPRRLWRRFQQGDGPMVLPTINLLRAFSDDIDAERIEPFGLDYDPQREQPVLELIHRLRHIPVPSPTLPPATTTNALLVGACLVDPSPRDERELGKLLHSLRDEPLESLLISHHHADHHRFAPEIARRRRLPLRCSARTARRLVERFGGDYLDGLQVETVAEGDVVAHWLGRPVRCYALPGHDDGMVGLAPDGMAWFFVGDLVQSVGSVVIPEPEGGMQAYFDSLQRVIDLQPKIVIPSHGIPSGGVWLLEQTLAHRREREAQVERLHREGKRPEQMVPLIYPRLADDLLPLAVQNVRQHLRRLGIDPEQPQ